jgi:hypothetical protein
MNFTSRIKCRGIELGGLVSLVVGFLALSCDGTEPPTNATGGTRAVGGQPSSGGTQIINSGGNTLGTGGTRTGGSPSSSGGKASGGSPSGGKASGGTPSGGTASGGKASGGTATGGKATGGARATGGVGSGTCNVGGSSSNGELTCYYFGQGTARETCNGSTQYKTNCGYCGTEGSASGNPCNTSHNDQVAHISTGNYWAAIPNWGQGANCGLCVSITYGGKTIVATIVDNCASCSASGHLDLSPAAGAALGMGTGSGQTEDVKSGVTWKAVVCPVGSSSIVAGYNGSYTGQLYFQNVAFPVKSASAVVNGTTHNANQTNGMWDFGVTLSSGVQLTLTDIMGHTVTGTLGSNGGSIGAQFPTTC